MTDAPIKKTHFTEPNAHVFYYKFKDTILELIKHSAEQLKIYLKKVNN